VVNDKEKKKAFFTSLGSPKARFRGAGGGAGGACGKLEVTVKR
jgi:hypothetical protein